MCAYSQVIGGELKADLAALSADDELADMRLRFARDGGEIIIDQMRWLTGAREPSGMLSSFMH